MSSYVDNIAEEDHVLLKRRQLKEFIKDCARVNCEKVVDILSERLIHSALENRTVLVGLCAHSCLGLFVHFLHHSTCLSKRMTNVQHAIVLHDICLGG